MLPPFIQVSDLKWISIWCREFSKSFGEFIIKNKSSFHPQDSYSEPLKSHSESHAQHHELPKSHNSPDDSYQDPPKSHSDSQNELHKVL